MATRHITTYTQIESGSGVPVSGAKLWFYAAGTTTPIDVFQDAGLSVPQTNPVIADSAGRFPTVYVGDEAYKIVLTDAADVTIQTDDNLGGAAGQTFTNPQINDATGAHQYLVTVSTLTLDREILLPELLTNDVFVFASHAQTLLNKTLTQPTITLKQGASPAPTAEGDIQWDTDDNTIKVGDGSGTKTFLPASNTVQALAGGGGTQTVDMAGIAQVTASLTVSTSANTLAITNPPASGSEGVVTLYITNGGSQTFNWPSGTVWPGGIAPVLTTSGVDIITLSTIDAGTTWYGGVVGLGMA